MLNKSKILSINAQFSSDISKKYGLYAGVGYYRQRMAARYLKEYTFVHAGKELLVPKDDLQKVIPELVKNANLVHTQRIDNPHTIVALLGACDFYNVPLIVDLDDHVFTTDGLAHDKHTYEDTDHKHYLEILLKEATALTVSTPPLVEEYKEYNPNIYLVPNAVDPKDWTWPLRHHTRPTVGWAGTMAHIVDHQVLEPVYAGVVSEHPDVVFSFVGHMLPDHIKGIQRSNWEIKPGISWWEGNPDSDMTYPRLLSLLGYDIGVAPLIGSQYNNARSLAKWFEYTMAGIPTVASAWGPYLDLASGTDVLLAQTTEQWVEHINHLFKNKHERDAIVDNARERIAREFTIDHTLPEWRSVFAKHLGYGFPK